MQRDGCSFGWMDWMDKCESRLCGIDLVLFGFDYLADKQLLGIHLFSLQKFSQKTIKQTLISFNLVAIVSETDTITPQTNRIVILMNFIKLNKGSKKETFYGLILTKYLNKKKINQ